MTLNKRLETIERELISIKNMISKDSITCTRCKETFTVEVPVEGRTDWICGPCALIGEMPVVFTVKDEGLYIMFSEFLDKLSHHIEDQLGLGEISVTNQDFSKQSEYWNQFFIEFNITGRSLVAIIDFDDILIPAGGCFEYGAMVYINRFTITIKKNV